MKVLKLYVCESGYNCTVGQKGSSSGFPHQSLLGALTKVLVFCSQLNFFWQKDCLWNTLVNIVAGAFLLLLYVEPHWLLSKCPYIFHILQLNLFTVNEVCKSFIEAIYVWLCSACINVFLILISSNKLLKSLFYVVIDSKQQRVLFVCV